MFKSGTSETDKEIIDRVQKLAEKKGVTMSQISLAWISKRVTSPIVGFSSVKRIEEAIGARGLVLSEDEEGGLEEVYVTREIEGHL